MPTPEYEISPAELTADLLRRKLSTALVPGGVIVGPANDDQQQAGCVQLAIAGRPKLEKYAPLIWVRAQLRCVSETLEHAERICMASDVALTRVTREEAQMDSTGDRYLVHLANVTAGGSMHYDSPETWEELLFAELLVGTDPIT